MQVSSFILLIGALAAIGWSAIWLRYRLSERRRRARQADWDELVRRYSDLDHELDQVWYRR
jgi:hypothetical protein